MAHIRTQIRDAAEAMLEGLDLFKMIARARPYPIPAEKCPAATLATPSERSGFNSMSQDFERTLDLEIAVGATGDRTVHDDLDDAAAAIEVAVANSDALKALTQKIEIKATTIEDGTDPAGTRVSLMVLTFECQIVTAPGAPDTLG